MQTEGEERGKNFNVLFVETWNVLILNKCKRFRGNDQAKEMIDERVIRIKDLSTITRYRYCCFSH